MGTHTTMPSPRLEAPGQGLPPIEAWIARYIIFPWQTRTMSKEQAVETLEQHGQTVLQLAQSTPEALLNERRLIARFPGIEDSSRYWSVLMTVQHLIITGQSMAQMTIDLAYGKKPAQEVRIEAVKPGEQLHADVVLPAYSLFLKTYRDTITPILRLNLHGATHAHPWFGEITAHQWLCLNAMHHAIHLKQMKRIKALLQ